MSIYIIYILFLLNKKKKETRKRNIIYIYIYIYIYNFFQGLYWMCFLFLFKRNIIYRIVAT